MDHQGHYCVTYREWVDPAHEASRVQAEDGSWSEPSKGVTDEEVRCSPADLVGPHVVKRVAAVDDLGQPIVWGDHTTDLVDVIVHPTDGTDPYPVTVARGDVPQRLAAVPLAPGLDGEPIVTPRTRAVYSSGVYHDATACKHFETNEAARAAWGA